jgi:hypothetical protein
VTQLHQVPHHPEATASKRGGPHMQPQERAAAGRIHTAEIVRVAGSIVIYVEAHRPPPSPRSDLIPGVRGHVAGG